MTYTIITPKAVQKQLDALPNDVYDRIAEMSNLPKIHVLMEWSK
jgi:mRNA-degrading endonuclease RelE of RelBE toxin-antitoxin system